MCTIRPHAGTTLVTQTQPDALKSIKWYNNVLRAKTLRLAVVEKLLSNTNEVCMDCYRCTRLGERIVPGDKVENELEMFVHCPQCQASIWL